MGGGGAAGEEDQGSSGVSVIGATVGFPYEGRHRAQFDYLFASPRQSSVGQRHFVTGSYVAQGDKGRVRGFFQVGAGIARVSFPYGQSESSLVIVVGGGATIDIAKSFFVRPQVRVYGYVGPALAILPSVGVGWRF